MNTMKRIYDDVGISYETDGKTAWCLNCTAKLNVHIPEGVIPHMDTKDCEYYGRLGAMWDGFLMRGMGARR